METRKLEEITITKRHRRDLGDIISLAQSIADVGLLHPIVIRPDNTLIAGQRRLEAFRLLGLVEIPVTVIDLAEVVRGEYAENADRKQFTPSEAVEIRRDLEPAETEAARQRVEHGRPRKTLENFSGVPDTGRAADKVAAAVGMSRPTLEKATAVVEAAEADPANADLVAQMDKTGKVSPAYSELQKRQRVATASENHSKNGKGIVIGDARNLPILLPKFGKKFGVIIADPPWPYQQFSDRKQGAASAAYNLLQIEDLAGMPVGDLAAKDCILFLWGTWPKLPEALQLMVAWGFQYVTGFPWVKTTENGALSYGVGFWVRGCSEYVLIGRRGNVSPPRLEGFLGLMSPTLRHSHKPDSVHQIAETLPGPYLELFARRSREGWTVFGNEVESEDIFATSTSRA